MTETNGIESLKVVLHAGAALEKMVVAAKADGKIDMNDFPYLMAAFPALMPLAGAYNNVLPELKDLSTEEAAQLIAYAMAEFTIGDEKAKAFVEATLHFAAAGYEYYKAYLAFKA